MNSSSLLGITLPVDSRLPVSSTVDLGLMTSRLVAKFPSRRAMSLGLGEAGPEFPDGKSSGRFSSSRSMLNTPVGVRPFQSRPVASSSEVWSGSSRSGRNVETSRLLL
jgi:hypothetical protein